MPDKRTALGQQDGVSDERLSGKKANIFSGDSF
jgi:hypothetical protein